MNQLSPRAQNLLARARGAGAPSPEACQRLAEGLQARLASGAATGAAGKATSLKVASLALKGSAVLGVSGALWVAGVALTERDSTELDHGNPRVSTSVSPLENAAPAPEQAPASGEGASPTRPATSAWRPPTPSGSAEGSAPARAPSTSADATNTPQRGARSGQAPREAARAPSASERREASSPVAGEQSKAPSATPPASDNSAARSSTADDSAAHNGATDNGASDNSAASGRDFPGEVESEQTPSLVAETQGLRAVQRALRRGDGAAALSLLAEQQQRFASGVLHQERAAARVQALCITGRAEAARAQAHSFERHWPRSPLLARVRAYCR